MSTALTAFYDMRDVIIQNQKNLLERRLPQRNTRNVNGLSLATDLKTAAAVISKLQGSPVLGRELLEQIQQQELLLSRRLDRSMSEPAGSMESRAITNTQLQQNQRNVNSSRYKTELCRPFEENGYCKYGDKCQFAHGAHELRNLARHPKYKTELCRTFHTIGFCPYGPRCHFIHNEDERKLSHINQLKQTSPNAVSAPTQVQRPRHLNFQLPLVRERDSLGSTADSVSPPSSIADSPSMSPTWLGEDLMAMRYSPPASAPAGLPAFTFPHDSAMSPLNVDTFASLSAGLNVLNIHNTPSVTSSASSTSSEVGLQQLRDALCDVFSPPSPPESVGSSHSDDMRLFRLPIFSQLSTE